MKFTRRNWRSIVVWGISAGFVAHMNVVGAVPAVAASPGKSDQTGQTAAKAAEDTATDRIPTATELRKWSNEQLRAALEKSNLGCEDEQLLLEVVRRGGVQWETFLAARHEALLDRIRNPPAGAEDVPRTWGLSNLHLLTALRRVQHKADPLRVLVAGKLEWKYSLSAKPVFTVLATNLDEEKQTVYGFMIGGDYRTGRLARWCFDVRDEQGRRLPTAELVSAIGGGFVTSQTLAYNESWNTELPLKSFVQIDAPGKYTLRVHRHNAIEIVGRDDISDLITACSAEIKLEVEPIQVLGTEAQRREARKWISQLPEAGPVKMAIGIIENETFLDPKSPAGRLQRLYTGAIPDLVDAALDPDLKPGQRAWVLGLLFAITGHNDPRGTPEFYFGGHEILGSYNFMGEGTSSSQGGKIDPQKQRAFAEKWRVWKTGHYYKIPER